MNLDIVLASASPRRSDLLNEAGVKFRIHAVDVDESLEPDLLANPAEAVKTLAQRKAHAAVEQLAGEGFVGDMVVIGADTMVAVGSEALGKPADEREAHRMLEHLSGRTHEVHTGVSLWMVHATCDEDFGCAYRSFTDTTRVTFRDLSPEEIDAYIATGDPMDKAGAYGIQSGAGVFVDRVDGHVDTVIGLPVKRLVESYPELLGLA